MNEQLRFDPMVYLIGQDYQIVFITSTMGLGKIEIGDWVFTDEEAGLPAYGNVHKISVDGRVLDEAGAYTVVFKEYVEKPPYFPKGVETVRKTYRFSPMVSNGHCHLFHFADTHSCVEKPLDVFHRYCAANGDVDGIILNGDISNHSDTADCFDIMFAIASGSVHGEKPILLSRGNHDTRGLSAPMLLDYIPTRYCGHRRETFWTFRSGNVWGLVLDCGEDKADDHEEYGGTVLFEAFRARQTEYLHSVIANARQEYAAEGVEHRIAICHIPFVDRFHGPFDIANEVYDEWVELMNAMGIDAMICGHTHSVYFLPPHSEGKRNADFLTAVCAHPSIPRLGNVYTGGAIVIEDGRREIRVVTDGEIVDRMAF